MWRCSRNIGSTCGRWRMMKDKYTYETSFEKAEQAGIDRKDYARESSKLCILTWIANELAEANRLKRKEVGE